MSLQAIVTGYEAERPNRLDNPCPECGDPKPVRLLESHCMFCILPVFEGQQNVPVDRIAHLSCYERHQRTFPPSNRIVPVQVEGAVQVVSQRPTVLTPMAIFLLVAGLVVLFLLFR